MRSIACRAALPWAARLVVGLSAQPTTSAQAFVIEGRRNVPSTDPYSPPMTEISSPFVIAAGTASPCRPSAPSEPPISRPTGTLEQLERYEGMRVFVGHLRV